ncbi:C-GCAxxG-C-C family protein [Chloroflexota bacterium]
MSKVESVLYKFKNDLDCAQAILSTYGPELGLDSEIAIKLTEAFTGGIGRMGETCGAVTGAFMVLGLKYGERGTRYQPSKKKTHSLVKEFVNRFISRNGSIVCKELLGCDIGNSEVLNSEKTKNLFKTACPKYVHNAAEIIEELLEIN